MSFSPMAFAPIQYNDVLLPVVMHGATRDRRDVEGWSRGKGHSAHKVIYRHGVRQLSVTSKIITRGSYLL